MPGITKSCSTGGDTGLILRDNIPVYLIVLRAWSARSSLWPHEMKLLPSPGLRLGMELVPSQWHTLPAPWQAGVFLPGGWRKEGAGQLCQSELAKPGALEASARRDRWAVDRQMTKCFISVATGHTLFSSMSVCVSCTGLARNRCLVDV